MTWFTLGLIAVLVSPAPAAAAPRTITYHLSSSRTEAPTRIHYAHWGEDVYDVLNAGSADGDTLPWTLTLTDSTTPRLRAIYVGLEQPAPTYTCDILINDVFVAHDVGVGVVDCLEER